MRRDDAKKFKVCSAEPLITSIILTTLQGSVFVEFKELASVEKFLKADPKPQWNGTELLIMSKCVPLSSPRHQALPHTPPLRHPIPPIPFSRSRSRHPDKPTAT